MRKTLNTNHTLQKGYLNEGVPWLPDVRAAYVRAGHPDVWAYGPPGVRTSARPNVRAVRTSGRVDVRTHGSPDVRKPGYPWARGTLL